MFGSGRAHQTAVKRINSMVLERQLSKSTHGGSAALDAMAKAVSVADHVLPIHKAMR